MFRPKITEEMRVVRQIGAKNCLKNIEIYLQDVAYGDTQRFRYSTLFQEVCSVLVYLSVQ